MSDINYNITTNPALTTSGDKKVSVSSNDATNDFLFNKLQGAAGVTLSEINDGGNEKVQIALTGGGINKRSWSWNSQKNGNISDAYFQVGDEVDVEKSPFIIPPGSYKIWAVSASTDGNETWTVRIFVDTGTGFPGSPSTTTGDVELSIAADDSGQTTANFSVSGGNKIAVFCKGSTIKDPNVTIFLEEV